MILKAYRECNLRGSYTFWKSRQTNFLRESTKLVCSYAMLAEAFTKSWRLKSYTKWDKIRLPYASQQQEHNDGETCHMEEEETTSIYSKCKNIT